MTDDDSTQALRRELAFLKEQIRDNERIWAGFREIEVRLIGANSPEEILAALVEDVPRIFPRISAVSLAYLVGERELSRLLHGHAATFIKLAADELTALFPAPCRPRLGPCTEAALSRYFPERRSCGSAAFVPLVLRGKLVGSLNELSDDVDHFHSSDATDLLEHLAAVLAMCLENALGRERLKQDGLTDPLTGIANRRLFDRRLFEEAERSIRRGAPLACLLADLDHFKAINDHFGHMVGDEVLRAVSTAIADHLRATDVLARYGGEEFVLLLPDTDVTHALAIAERLRAAVAALDLVQLAGQRHLSISVGVAGVNGRDTCFGSGEQLLRQADLALYEAKSAGRNCVRYSSHPLISRKTEE